MRIPLGCCYWRPIALLVALLAIWFFWQRSSQVPDMSAKGSRSLTKADIDRWMEELSNWGRWGDSDELGALNFITPEKRKQAAALVREGVSVSLARDIEKEESVDNPYPVEHAMLLTGKSPGMFSNDAYRMQYHGWAHTHMDSLCHMFYGGKMFNGFSRMEVTDGGANKLGIETVKDGVFSRGILMDIPALKGVDYLEPGEAIYPEDLDAWEKKAGVKVGRGDVVLVRTGRWARRDAKGPGTFPKRRPECMLPAPAGFTSGRSPWWAATPPARWLLRASKASSHPFISFPSSPWGFPSSTTATWKPSAPPPAASTAGSS